MKDYRTLLKEIAIHKARYHRCPGACEEAIFKMNCGCSVLRYLGTTKEECAASHKMPELPRKIFEQMDELLAGPESFYVCSDSENREIHMHWKNRAAVDNIYLQIVAEFVRIV